MHSDSVDNESVDSQGSNEKYEDKLLQAIENATEKSVQIRVNALLAMSDILSQRFLPDFVENRKITIIDIIERSIRRGKGDEQATAVQLVPMLVFQLGSSGDVVLKALGELLMTTTLNKAVSYNARAKCCTALGLLNYLGGEAIADVIELMQTLESIFRGGYEKSDPEASVLHCAALSAWGLLLTLLSPKDFCLLFNSNSFAP